MTKKKLNLLKFIYFISIISFSGILYLIYDSYNKDDSTFLNIGLLSFFVLLFVVFYTTYDIHSTIRKAQKTRDMRLVEYIENKHILCRKPWECDRCWGWYLSFPIVFASIFNSPSLWMEIAKKMGIENTIIISIVLFIISTPIHGTITRLYQKLKHPLFRFIGGLLTGISLALLAGALFVELGL